MLGKKTKKRSDGRIKMDEKEIFKKVVDEIGEAFKDQVADVKDSLKDWSKIVVELRAKQLTEHDEDELAELKKSEEYAWAGIMALKAKHEQIFVDKTWELMERILKTLRIAFLF
jgi:hypothetical protein